MFPAPAWVALGTPIPTSICIGEFATMTAVAGWSSTTPATTTADACLTRCAGESTCKLVKFNTETSACFAYTAYSGACTANTNGDNVYLAKATSLTLATPATTIYREV